MNSQPTAPVGKGDILIVDDKPDNLRTLSTMLETRGYHVRKAINGQLALQRVQMAPPDLILLDINMPTINGYEVCEKLKSSEQSCDIPIIFISALDEVLDKVKAFQVGGVDYITKPFYLEEVLTRVETHLTQRKLSKQLQEQNTQLQIEILERQRSEEQACFLLAALVKANQDLERLANTDGLTGVANRRRFDECLIHAWRRLFREQLLLSLILCDVDFCKHYNDTYGHQAGDDCLRQMVTKISKGVKRPADLVARYSGDEFAIVLPNTDAKQAVFVAEAIQKEVEQLKITHTRF